MSGAIFGKINLDGIDVNFKEAEVMEKTFVNYKLDEVQTLSEKNAFMGCGLLHVTKEDEKEILPYYDEERCLFITADAILDNREDLIIKLNLELYQNIITDSQIILKSYTKWKYRCVDYLLGDFAFVIWDEKNKEIFCVKDCVGTRTLYYKFKDNSFSFGTLIDSIYENENLNEKWLSDFIALPVVLHHSESEETVYEDIYEVSPGTFLIINNDGIKKIKYWDAVKNSKKIKFNSDEEYIEEFKNIFKEAVRCRLRTNHNIGISMSGGMDSSSVGCISASILKKTNRNLISFTSVPMTSYCDTINNCGIADETEYVEEIKKLYDNIQVNYCRSEERDSLTDMDKTIGILEQPYKTYQNMFWCTEVMNRASDKGCKVLLTGQFGNFTISYGDFFTNMRTLINKKRFLKFIKEIRGCSELHNISNFFTLKQVLKVIEPNIFNIKDNESNKTFNKSPLNNELISKWDIAKRFEEEGLVLENNRFNDMYYEREFITNDRMFTQIGTIETKLALSNGLIERDPTKDKRIIEFCFGINEDQYVKNGLDRYLIRRSMKGIIPEKIRCLQGEKGLQGADWLQRIKNKKEYICSMLDKCIIDKNCNKYLNMDYIKEQREMIENKLISDNDIDIRSIFISINLYIFFSKRRDLVEEMDGT